MKPPMLAKPSKLRDINHSASRQSASGVLLSQYIAVVKELQQAEPVAHLIGKHVVCLLHFLQQLQSRLEVRVLHIALDQCAVAPDIQSHT